MAKPIRMPSGKWRVRWRDETGKLRQRTFAKQTPAKAWANKINTARDTDDWQTVDRRKVPLGDVAQLCDSRRWSNRSVATRNRYRRTWTNHISPYLGQVPVRLISTSLTEDWLGQLESDGVGADARRRALSLLRSIMSRAVEWEYAPTNPLREVPMPEADPKTAVRPLTPVQSESIARAADRERDRQMIRLMAFAGLRPQEVMALRADHVRKRTLLIEQAVADGAIKATKTERIRSVDLLDPLGKSLRAWIMESGQRELLFPGFQGEPMREHDYRNWCRRIFTPAATLAKVDATPYTLRHSFASLLIHAGHPVTYVAAQLGHSPTMCLNTYAHVFADLDSTIDANTAVAEAMTSDPSSMILG